MPLSNDRRAFVAHLTARAKNGAPLAAAQTGPLRAWRLDASPAEAAQIDALVNPGGPAPTAAYAAGQRRADVVNAQQEGMA